MELVKKLSIKEQRRLIAMSKFEIELRQIGYKFIAGVDEAGRGPLAGPVVAAACILPEGFKLNDLNDSKQVAPQKRKELYQELINSKDVIYSVGIVDSKTIDQINILQATLRAMEMAIFSLTQKPDILLIDGNQLPTTSIPSKAIIQGDSLSISIAAASIIAKLTRDTIMEEYHLKWPEYDFFDHKGYGTKKHLEALAKHGPCEIHRRSFEHVEDLNLSPV